MQNSHPVSRRSNHAVLVTVKRGKVDMEEAIQLDVTMYQCHPVKHLGFHVYFAPEDTKLFPSHKVPPPLNRFLGKGKQMYVVGISVEALQTVCGIGSAVSSVPQTIIDSDDGSEIISSESEVEEEEDD